MSTKVKENIILVHGCIQRKALAKLPTKANVFITEGRPGLESSQYLSQELLKQGIKPTLIADNMAGFLFYKKMIKEVWLAYHEIQSEDALSPIGSMVLAVLAKKHKVPVKCFYGGSPKKLMGAQKDLLNFNNMRVAARGIKGYVPLVETVPLNYIGKYYD